MKKRIVAEILILVLSISMASCSTNTNENEYKDKISIFADYPVYDTEEACVKKASLIFSGTITDISYEMIDLNTDHKKDPMTGLDTDMIPPTPYTICTVDISEVYKGKLDNDVVRVKCVGGIIGDILYESEFSKKIKIDRNYLFLLSTYENSLPNPINPEQGMIDLQDDTEGLAKRIIELT